MALGPFSISVLGLAGLLGISSCAAAKGVRFVGLARVNNAPLRSTVRDYYRYESRMEWRKTYDLRSSNFRKLVRFNDYSRSMDRSYVGWTLTRIAIQSVQCRGGDNECSILIKFSERVTGKAAKTLGTEAPSTALYTDRTEWKLAAHGWVALDAGVRSHVPLDANMADN